MYMPSFVLFLVIFILLMRCNCGRLFLAIGFQLFAVNDEKFMGTFVAPGAVSVIQNSDSFC
jgi:hypothetical protein